MTTMQAPRADAARRTVLRPCGGRFTKRLYYLALAVLAVYSLAPMVIFVFSALKSETELATNPLGPPHHWLWSNFVTAWNQADIGTGLKNSAIITLGTMVGVCFIAGCASYSMARLNLPGGNGVIIYLIATIALPVQLFLVPLFYLWVHLHLFNTLPGVIVIYWAVNSPFATLLLRSFMVGVPRELEESARIDGASEIGVMWRVTIPVVAPGFITIALVSGLAAWNNFLIALVFLTSPGKSPVSISLYAFQQGYSQNDSLIAAAAMFMLVPMLLLFVALQRRFVAGLTTGSLVG
jgi:raffinose/stachyose/melibiose transport system permease protein